MAALGRRGLDRRKSVVTAGDVCFVLVRLGVAADLHMPDRSLRSVRSAAGMALPAWPPSGSDQFQNAVAVPTSSTSALSELADHLLGDTPDDRGPSCLRGGDDGLHLRGHSIRRAGPDPILSG